MYGSRGWRTRDDKDVYSSMNLVNVNVKHDNWRCFGSKSINSREWKTNEKNIEVFVLCILRSVRD